MGTVALTDTRWRKFCAILTQVAWTGETAVTAEQVQHQIDAEYAHDDAAQEQAEREAEAEAERGQAEAAQARQARRSEDASRRRQQAVRDAQIMFAHYVPIAA